MFESERRDLDFIPRWSIIRVNRRQTVASHSYYVACYGLEIAARISWPSGSMQELALKRLKLAHFLLRHDEGEALTGDVPGPVKRLCFDEEPLIPLMRSRFGAAVGVDEDMLKIKRAADALDECMYLAGEINSGNRAVMSAFENSRNRLDDAVMLLPGNVKVSAALLEELRQVVYREISQTKDLTGLLKTERAGKFQPGSSAPLSGES